MTGALTASALFDTRSDISVLGKSNILGSIEMKVVFSIRSSLLAIYSKGCRLIKLTWTKSSMPKRVSILLLQSFLPVIDVMPFLRIWFIDTNLFWRIDGIFLLSVKWWKDRLCSINLLIIFSMAAVIADSRIEVLRQYRASLEIFNIQEVYAQCRRPILAWTAGMLT